MSTRLFSSQTPISPLANDNHTYTLGTVEVPAVAGAVPEGWWYASNPVPTGTVTFVLYDLTTTAELARKAFGTLTPGAWNSVTLTVPISLAANQAVIACIVTADRYVASSGFFNVQLTNGNLRGPATSEIANGRFNDGADGFPTGSFGGGCYFVDMSFEPSVGTTITSTLDARWRVSNVVTSTLDARWRVYNRIASTLDARWRVGFSTVTSLLDARWRVYSRIASTLDARWQVISDIVAPTVKRGSWFGLLDTQNLARQMYEEDNAGPPAACPNDGEPLVTNSDGELRCPFDGWEWRP